MSYIYRHCTPPNGVDDTLDLNRMLQIGIFSSAFAFQVFLPSSTLICLTIILNLHLLTVDQSFVGSYISTRAAEGWSLSILILPFVPSITHRSGVAAFTLDGVSKACTLLQAYHCTAL
ncbi:uncharacterized protein ARMOST_20569 [Armillaria ostoyae]|uniref:Uncharacterized protein n=1 Tax=Armillaria ostoyae TaxID=47428 RepID=A0A284S7P6_ARMOS|nr:uncharacterized protein ARMOST_20569 [Armillaria ostoyae]